MNQSIAATSINSHFFIEKHEKKEEKEDPKVSDMTYLAPLAGAFLTHNATQGLLLGRAISYFPNPITNYFGNLPLAAIGGCATYILSRAILGESEKNRSLGDYRAVIKSIGWSTAFNTASAIGLTQAILTSKTIHPVTRAFFDATYHFVGSFPIVALFVVTSTCLSIVFLSLADEIFKEDFNNTEKTKSNLLNPRLH